ncbi:MAG: hypothetical protein HC888_06075 [Candidatus Competibacteraceae bacterium]|nr:hypothetical protein [Candidatus Competibacteraceae bacterium]
MRIMIDWVWLALIWLALMVAVLPIVIGIGWAVVEGSILPRLVPRKEIEAMADEVMRHHPENPEDWAFMEEHAAWYRSLSFEQGKWHRVREAIRMRLLAGDPPPAA